MSMVLDIAKEAILANRQCQEMEYELGLTQTRQAWTRFICGAMSFVAADDEDEDELLSGPEMYSTYFFFPPSLKPPTRQNLNGQREVRRAYLLHLAVHTQSDSGNPSHRSKSY
jgi:hypothetical protein